MQCLVGAGRNVQRNDLAPYFGGQLTQSDTVSKAYFHPQFVAWTNHPALELTGQHNTIEANYGLTKSGSSFMPHNIVGVGRPATIDEVIILSRAPSTIVMENITGQPLSYHQGPQQPRNKNRA